VDLLGDIGGVVADSLDVFCDEQEVRAGRNRVRIFHHVSE